LSLAKGESPLARRRVTWQSRAFAPAPLAELSDWLGAHDLDRLEACNVSRRVRPAQGRLSGGFFDQPFKSEAIRGV